MGFAERVLARAAPEQRAITEWGTSAIPGPLGNLTGGGGSYSSIDLRRAESSLQKVAVWSAVDLIAGVASQLPLQTFQSQADGTGKLIPTNPKLVDDPGGEDQGVGDWVYQYLGSKLLRGNAFGKTLSPDSRTGYPTQIVLYHPDEVSGYRDKTTGVAVWRVNGVDVPAGQMWFRRAYPVAGQLLGLSPIGQHATTIGQGIAAARFGQQFFTDGGHPTAVVQNSEEEIDQKKAVEVKARWTSAVWGSREPVVMGRGWDFKPLSISPDESQFLETQKFTGAECCRIFGPNIAEILGYETGSSMTYANQEQRAIDFLKFTLNRWLRDVETVLTKYLPRPQYVRFNRKVLLETDLLTRYQAHQTARQIGLNNIDELRGEEDLSPLPNGQGQDYTPLLVQVAASRGIDAAQVHAGQPAEDQPLAARSAAPDPKDGEVRRFDPAEPRRPDGKWGTAGGAVSHALKDALKLDGKIDLAPDEKLVGSGKVDGDAGGIRMALTEQNGKRMLRFGVGSEGYGQRDRENGIPAWDGNPSHAPLSAAEKQRLNAESDALDEEEDSASPARQAEIDARKEAIREQLTTDELGFNGTAKVDEESMRRLADQIRPALDEAVVQDKVENSAWDEIEALQAKGNPDPARLAELQRIARADSTEAVTFTEGVIPGSEWGDVHYEVYLDDPSVGPRVLLGVKPKGTPDDWGADKDWQGQFDPAEARKFLKLIGQYAGTTPQTTRAAGHDTIPGHDELHHYWTQGPGLAKWVGSPTPWTTLRDHLLKYLPPGEATRAASKWFEEVFGFASGSDLNRVTHGKPPRGHRVGPG